MKPLAHHKLIAAYEAKAFSIARPPISVFRDESGSDGVFLLEARDRPILRSTSFATIGLSDQEVVVNGKVLNHGLELVGACDSIYPIFGNLIATAAFLIRNSKWSCAPGVIFPDIAALHDESLDLCDLYFTYPFSWPRRMDELTIDGRRIAFLQAIPIAKSETELANSLGPRELENRFERSGVNIFDLKRDLVS